VAVVSDVDRPKTVKVPGGNCTVACPRPRTTCQSAVTPTRCNASPLHFDLQHIGKGLEQAFAVQQADPRNEPANRPKAAGQWVEPKEMHRRPGMPKCPRP
jgi:hypothetical protein